jgi:hypothetical protein
MSAFPTRMDRVMQVFTVVLAVGAPVALGVATGLEDGVVPVLAFVAVAWPNLGLMYLFYRWRRRLDLAYEADTSACSPQ